MKIVLFFNGGQYHYRSYYTKGEEENKNVLFDWGKHIKNSSLWILLIDSILSAFNEYETNANVKDITEIEFQINSNGGNLILNNITKEVKAPIHISLLNQKPILLTIENVKIDSLQISQGNIQWIHTDSTDIWDLKIEWINLTGFVIIRNNTSIHSLIFEKCSMSDELWVNTRLELDNSKIWTLVLNRTSFPNIISINTEISWIFPYKMSFKEIEVKWKNGFLKILEQFESWNNTPSEMKDYYRQLKHSHDEIWNKTEATKFFAKEMEYYEKSLSLSEWDKKLISKLQKFSNNYWNSWLQPFIWIIAVSFLYTYLSDCWDFKCTCWWIQDWSCFSSHWLKNVSQFPTELKNAKDWWFFLYAIIMGSLFYQLLVALRRISQR